jgi:hypothetical protein
MIPQDGESRGVVERSQNPCMQCFLVFYFSFMLVLHTLRHSCLLLTCELCGLPSRFLQLGTPNRVHTLYKTLPVESNRDLIT